MEDRKDWVIAVGESKQLYGLAQAHEGSSITERKFTYDQMGKVIDEFYFTYGNIQLGESILDEIGGFVEEMKKLTDDHTYDWRRFFIVLVGMIS